MLPCHLTKRSRPEGRGMRKTPWLAPQQSREQLPIALGRVFVICWVEGRRGCHHAG